MSSLQPVRGTHDLLPEAMRRHRRVIEAARAVAELYGFHEMATPIFEFTEVFKRTLGDTSDIVTKEMYTFAMGGERAAKDEEGASITLRPENTAGVARAFISGGLAQQVPLKVAGASTMVLGVISLGVAHSYWTKFDGYGQGEVTQAEFEAVRDRNRLFWYTGAGLTAVGGGLVIGGTF